MATRASVIIVNWNGLQYLTECLDSLAAQTFCDFEIILVDNGSQDGSIAFVQERYPSVRLIPLSENTGFARGNNVGFEAAQGDYLVTLNNDTWVDPRWLEMLVAAADADITVGMVASRICTYSDPDCLDSIGVTVCRDGMSRAAFRNRSFSELGFNGVREILLPSACAALYRKKMINEVGGFDDDFFAYCEDTDLGLRGRLAGWKAVAALEAIVLHKYSGTGGVFSPFKLYQVERNHFWAALKCFPVGMLMLLPVWTFVRYLMQAQLVLQAKGAGSQFREASSTQLVLALMRALVDALRALPRMLRKRRNVMRRLSPCEMTRLLADYRLSFRNLLDVD
jgi:GT2 family glycosyltransferase